MYRRFNNANIDGTLLSQADIIEGGGELSFLHGVKQVTTLDHRIRRVLVNRKGKVKMILKGDRESLATQARAADDDNFGGTHKFYMDTTLVATLDGLVNVVYDYEKRLTTLEINGEYGGVV